MDAVVILCTAWGSGRKIWIVAIDRLQTPRHHTSTVNWVSFQPALVSGWSFRELIPGPIAMPGVSATANPDRCSYALCQHGDQPESM